MDNLPELQERLNLAKDAALDAGLLTLKYFQNPKLAIETKPNATPVTEADKNAEKRLRELISAQCPDDGILGEEFDEKPGNNGYRWILDPIDGTKSFVRGVPLYGTMVGLEHEGKAVAGVVFFPGLGEMMFGAIGCGAFWVPRGLTSIDANIEALAQPARVSQVEKLDDALFTTTSVSTYHQAGTIKLYEALRAQCGLARGWGDCYGHMLVATGRADVMVDPMMNAWDCAALAPIVEEAGGTFTDLKGESSIHGGNALSTNSKVFDQVMALVNESV